MRTLLRRALVLTTASLGLSGLIPAPPSAVDSTPIIVSVAGRNPFIYPSGDGGPAVTATLQEPVDVAVDDTGNLYIADDRQHRLRRIDGTSGVITTIAGTGTAGFWGDGGPAAQAQLNRPRGIAVLRNGEILTSDTGNHRVRRIDMRSGDISTIAGTGTAGFAGDGGPASSASLNGPEGMAVDVAGNVYIADRGNHRIRKIDASGTISTVAGNGAVLLAGDGAPALQSGMDAGDVAVAANGDLFIADAFNNRVRRITVSDGLIQTIAGHGDSGMGLWPDAGPNCIENAGAALATDRCLYQPGGIAVDPQGNAFVSDTWHRRVWRIAATGEMTAMAGTGVSGYSGDLGPAGNAMLSDPAGITLDTAGNLYFADTGNYRIRELLVTSAPAVLVHPGPCVVQDGEEVALYARAIGGPMPWVQWQISDDERTWADVVGATSSTYTFVARAGDTGKLFRAVFANARGTATTRAARLQIAVPSRADFDGDSAADLIIVRPDSGGSPSLWFWLPSTRSHASAAGRLLTWSGPSGEQPLLGDLDGDGIVDPIGRDRLNRSFWWITSKSGYLSCWGDSNCDEPLHRVANWGAASDIPLIGDMDGDRRDDFILFRPSNGTWYWVTSGNGYDTGRTSGVQWGNDALGDRPLLADIDGDGIADLVIWRASTGTWYWLTSSSGYNYAYAESRQWGNSALGDIPLVADFDGDGKSDLAVWRSREGTWYWLTSKNGFSYATAQARQWGNAASGDVPLVGDVDGDGYADLIVWRRTTGTWYWLRSSNAYSYAAAGAQQWGNSALGDIPLVK